VPYRVLGRGRRTSPGPAAAALRLARGSDLIHSHLFGNNVWGAVLARAAGVPLVAHEHNRVARHVPFEAAFDRLLIASTAARILCVADSNAAALRANGLRRGAIEVVPNGVRSEGMLSRAAARAAIGLRPDDVVVGVVAALRPEKAHDVLLRSFRILVDLDLHPRLRLCLVGDGSCRRMLTELARALGIDERVDFVGERPDAPLLHRAFDVAVVGSRSEGLPLSALESLAAGTPLVASRVGGLPQLLEDRAGLLVEPGDEHGLAAAIAAVLDDPGLARRFAQNGRRRIAAQYGFEQTVKAVEATYRAVLAEHLVGVSRRAGRGRGEAGSRVESLV
jgi:glycosyltransferase involved in cell wall biosynthesis